MRDNSKDAWTKPQKNGHKKQRDDRCQNLLVDKRDELELSKFGGESLLPLDVIIDTDV